MYNSLEKLPQHVVLDSNVCLNAAFISNSIARPSIGLLRQLGFTPFVSEQIVNECEAQLWSIAQNTEKALFYVRCFRSWIERERLLILQVSNVAVDELADINRSDRPVVKAMQQYRAWLLTNDAPLFVEVKSVGGEPRFPMDVVVEAGLNTNDKKWPMWAVVRCHPMRRQQGSFFVRFDTLWSTDQVRRATPHLFDVNEFMSVFYNGISRRIVARHDQGIEVSIPVEIVAGEMQTVLVNYMQPGRLQLRVSGISDPVQATLGAASEIALSQPVGQMFIQCDRQSSNQLNGHLRALVAHPKTVSGDRWRAYLSIPNASPNPWDEVSLGDFIRGL